MLEKDASRVVSHNPPEPILLEWNRNTARKEMKCIYFPNTGEMHAASNMQIKCSPGISVQWKENARGGNALIVEKQQGNLSLWLPASWKEGVGWAVGAFCHMKLVHSSTTQEHNISIEINSIWSWFLYGVGFYMESTLYAQTRIILCCVCM